MPTHLLLRGETLNNDKPESLDQACKSGAMVVEIFETQLTNELHEDIRKKRLSLVLQCNVSNVSSLEAVLARAVSARAMAINARVETPHLSHEESAELAHNLINLAASAGIPFYFETHAGCITHDLYRTSLLVTDVPDMRFTLDAAHYITSEETAGPVARLASLLTPILDRTEMIRGRITTDEHATQYAALWAETMRRWRIRKPVGSSLVFIPQPANPTSKTEPEIITGTWIIAQSAWKASATSGKTPAWPAEKD